MLEAGRQPISVSDWREETEKKIDKSHLENGAGNKHVTQNLGT